MFKGKAVACRRQEKSESSREKAEERDKSI